MTKKTNCKNIIIEQISSELLRISRGSNDVSILVATLDNDLDNLDILSNIIKHHLGICDTLSTIDESIHIAVIPGFGQIQSLQLAEEIQKTCTKNSAIKGDCNIGLVCLDRGNIKEHAKDIIQKAKHALKKAVNQKNHIYQEGPGSVDDQATLVHSNEKRFLFFGGD